MATIPTLVQGRYAIVRPVGQGGMGTVYEATDRQTGATVAIKHLALNTPESHKAFAREAQLLAGLQHPALPRVLDYCIDEQDHFLVMEFIAGPDLAERLQSGGPLPVEQVLDWADQLLGVLDYLHTHAPPVIHRDIKPQNLKLDAAGRVVLLDFGLAKGSASQQTLTINSVMGYTATYAPLEQIQGNGTEPRSDLYALGATIYHLLTGTPPADALTRAAASLNGDPNPLAPANRVNQAVPAAVGNVLTQAMAQSIKQRFASARTMGLALKNAATQRVPAAAYEGATIAQVKGHGTGNSPASAQPARPGSGRSRPAMAPLPDLQGTLGRNPLLGAPLRPVVGPPPKPIDDQTIGHPQAGPRSRPLVMQPGAMPSIGDSNWMAELPWSAIFKGIGIFAMIVLLIVSNQSRDPSRNSPLETVGVLLPQESEPAPAPVLGPSQITYNQTVAFKDACVSGDTAKATALAVEPISETVGLACYQIAANTKVYPDFFLGASTVAKGEESQRYAWPLVWAKPNGERATVTLSFEKRFEKRNEVYKIVAIDWAERK